MPARAPFALRLLRYKAAAALALALACWARPAAAKLFADIAVERTAEAEGCPDAPQLADAVNRSLGRTAAVVAGGGRGDVSIAVRFFVDQRGYLAYVEARGLRQGARTLDDKGGQCTGLAEAVALSIAFFLEDDAPRQAQAPPQPAPARKASPQVAAQIEAGALLTDVFARRLSAGVFAEAGVTLPYSLSVGGGGLWLPDRAIRSVAPGRVDFGLLAGTLYACWAPVRPAWLTLGLCARPAAGSLRAEASGYRQANRDARRFWAAAGASLDASGRLVGPLSWAARAGALVPLQSDRFTVDGEPVLRTSGPSFFLGAGVRATIW